MAEIGANAQKQNPALRALNDFVGDWRTTGSHPFFPNTELYGRASFQWQDGGAFLVWRSEIDDPHFPAGIAIFGSDDQAGTIFISYFDERGISRKYDITMEAHGFTMHRDDPKLSQRMTFTIEADKRRILSIGEMSRDGGAWESDLCLTYDRVSEAA